MKSRIALRATKAEGQLRLHAAPLSFNVRVGVVGLGLMGTSVATCLLAAGHPVAGVEIDPTQRRIAKRRVLALLQEMRGEGLLRHNPARIIQRLSVSDGAAALRGSAVIIEAIVENLDAKKQVIRSVEAVVDPTAIIGSNTSAIPLTLIQQDAVHPERVLGTHWAEPAHVTRFMEIICGGQTDPRNAERVRALGKFWGKEASIVRRDIRGFIANRCFYALLREAFHLVESGYATVEDVDRSLRNDLGYWMTFAGPFRYLDLTGIPAYEVVMRDLFPDLSRSTAVTRLISDLVKSGARGVATAKGFYPYTPRSAKQWERRFQRFMYDVRALALKYPENEGHRVSTRRAGRREGNPRS